MKKITIAIDGHSSCGKSTMAKDLAREVGYIYVDTGAMYRSVTLYALRKGLFEEDGAVKTSELESEMPNIHISFELNKETGRPDTYLNGECVEKEIRSLEVSSHVSPIAAIGFVRKALVAQQQQMGKDKGVVMDGRDIGTVVFPDAELKVFVTASAKVRAQRRFDELQAKRKALQDAEIGYNLTQQSSEGAMVSEIQMQRTIAANMLSVFRNSSMSYTRQTVDALRNLKHRMQKGYREEAVKYLEGQLMEEGLDEGKAKAAARAEYRRGLWHDLARVVVAAWLLPIFWNLGSSLPYLVFGDDDEEKKKMGEDALIKGFLAGPVEGFVGGNIVKDVTTLIGSSARIIQQCDNLRCLIALHLLLGQEVAVVGAFDDTETHNDFRSLEILFAHFRGVSELLNVVSSGCRDNEQAHDNGEDQQKTKASTTRMIQYGPINTLCLL